MPAFAFRAPENTYLQNTSGGTIATAASKDLVVEWAKALEPRKTPILDRIMSNEEFDQELHQWGQSFRIPMRSKLASAANNSIATLTVTTGEGSFFQIGSVIEVYTPKTGTDIPDPSTYEQLIVTGITGDTLTVATRGTSGTSAFAHSQNDVVQIIGTTEALNGAHTEAPRYRGIRAFNYPQRFQAQLTADKRAQNMSTWENPSNPLLADFAEEMLKQKRLLEESVFKGRRLAGIGSASPSRFGGLDYFITSNEVNLNSAKLTGDDLDDVIADMWLESDEVDQLSIVCSMNTARILDMTIDPSKREAQMDTDEYNRVVRKYHFRTGTFVVEPTRHVPDGTVYLLNFNDIKVRPFKGLNWHVSGKDGATHAVDHDVKAVSGDFTLEVQREHGMARITGFEGRIGEYP
ncbi:SU10 major capsid protein [Methylobacillus sp.]|uniref:SU10 major capsid protein n=1 Tax=Methylobacillus sp. TaxID=56818 RepID=UPI002FE2145A